MSVPYTKPHLTLDAQVQLLLSRGMIIPDESRAIHVLGSIGYYRLSGYWYPYRQQGAPGTDRLDQFDDGTMLDQVLALYDFDRRLKLLLLDALERIEIAARVQVGHVLGRRDAFAHLDIAHLDAGFDRPGRDGKRPYRAWLARVEAAQGKSNEDFVKHFRAKYHDRLPTWVVTEILDFGGISWLYSGLKRPDRDEIATWFGAIDGTGRGSGKTLKNWLMVVNYIRNVCAHHSRLWNRNMDVQIAPADLRSMPGLADLASGSAAELSRVFGALSLTLHLLDRVADGPTVAAWRGELLDLVVGGLEPSGRSLREMGFPSEWRTRAVWNS